MAKIHRISRQTLIHYDKIGLFKPEITKENGYRYYSVLQIPVLREICFLRSLRVPTEDIKMHLESRTPKSVVEFFTHQQQLLDAEIQELLLIKQHIQYRLNSYKPYLEYQIQMQKPTIRHYPERKVIFIPYATPINKEKLHYTLMQAWRIINALGYQFSCGFGTIIRQRWFSTTNVLEGAGVYVALPKDVQEDISDHLMVLPAGDYVTAFKYGMPYDIVYLYQLLDWMGQHGYTPCGDVVDACIFDTTFYSKDIKLDFCQLQIPISLDG